MSAAGYVTENVGVALDLSTDEAAGYVVENVGFSAAGRFTVGSAAGGPTRAHVAGYVVEYVTTDPVYPDPALYPGADLYPQG